MIVVDFMGVILADIMSNKDFHKTNIVDEDLIRHVTLTGLLSIKKAHSSKFGKIVISCDYKGNWRKNVFPLYKAKRSIDRDKDKEKWENIFKFVRKIIDELKETFPYTVLEVESCESDDIIAVLAKWSQTNDLEESLFDSQPKPFLIVSKDTDFFQLQKYKNVKQYSKTDKKFLVCDNIEEFMFDHIVRGDAGDGIPNITSPDDCFLTGTRQKPITEKKVQTWKEEISKGDIQTTFCDLDAEQIRKNYERNRTLVDFEYIPEVLQNEIINKYTAYECNSRSKLHPYFIKHRLSSLLDSIQEF